MSATINNFSAGDKAKIQGVIASGVDVLREIATLKEGLKENVTAVAEELELEKKHINRAIRMAYKSRQQNQNVVEDAQDELDAVEILLKTAGI